MKNIWSYNQHEDGDPRLGGYEGMLPSSEFSFAKSREGFWKERSVADFYLGSAAVCVFVCVLRTLKKDTSKGAEEEKR